MVLISGLERLLGWKRFRHMVAMAVKMMKCLTIKKFFFAGHLPVYRYSPFVIVSSAGGEPRPVYEGLCTVEDYDEGYFVPT
jgi:hypothetical protein